LYTFDIAFYLYCYSCFKRSNMSRNTYALLRFGGGTDESLEIWGGLRPLLEKMGGVWWVGGKFGGGQHLAAEGRRIRTPPPYLCFWWLPLSFKSLSMILSGLCHNGNFILNHSFSSALNNYFWLLPLWQF